MESSLGCLDSCSHLQNPTKLRSNERYLMRQKYLRSYPLMMTTNKKKEKGIIANKWLKYCRIHQWNNKQTVGSEEVKKSKPKFPASSSLKACFKMLLVCVVKVDVVWMVNLETSGLWNYTFIISVQSSIHIHPRGKKKIKKTVDFLQFK